MADKVTQAIPLAVRLCTGLFYGLPPGCRRRARKTFLSCPRSYPGRHHFNTSLDSIGNDSIRLFTCLDAIMAQAQLHTTCDDCISLLQHAATIISESACLSESSSDQTKWTTYDKQYQTRLLANVASSECYMCAHLHEQIPQLSKSYEFVEEFQMTVGRAQYDPLASHIWLVARRGAGNKRQTITGYPGGLRVHEGKTWQMLVKSEIIAHMSHSRTRKYANCQFIPDVVPRIVELYTIMAKELHIMP